MAERRRAFLDESLADGAFYTMAAVVITARDEPRMDKDLRAGGWASFHAHYTDEPERRAFENFILSQRTTAVVGVYAPMGDSPEFARGHCLSTLAATLREKLGVTELVMDSRDDLHKAPSQRLARPNDNDRKTIAQLNDGDRERITIDFKDDDHHLALKLPDMVAWRTRHALANPSLTEGVKEFARLAPITVLVAASGSREDGLPGAPMLRAHLTTFQQASRELSAPDRLNIHDQAARLREQASDAVRRGAPDWSDYFQRAGQWSAQAPRSPTAWDVFAGKGTTPTIRPRTDNPDQTRRQQLADPARRPAPGQRPADTQTRGRDDQQRRRRPGPGAEEKTQRRPRPPQQTPRQQRRPNPPDKPRGLSR